MKILFRADSSSTIGTGHIMRDLVLATQYPDSQIIFATQDLEGNLNAKIVESGYQVKNLLSNDLEELVQVVNEFQIEMIVIDHYGIDYAFEKVLKEETNIKIMVLDDTYEKHYCDILLNHNIYADANKYRNLVPNNCELRCGSQYTLLREEFIKEKQKKTIFLAMGGADHSNMNIKILEVLKEFKNIEVHVVTTVANKHLEELKSYAKDLEWIILHINSNQLGKLMKKSDFAIITPSVTANEAYFMELPFIAIQTADNQSEMVEFLEKNEYPVLKTFDPTVLYHAIKPFWVVYK